MSGNSSDHDSLVALEGLLRIRESKVIDPVSAKSSRRVIQDVTNSANLASPVRRSHAAHVLDPRLNTLMPLNSGILLLPNRAVPSSPVGYRMAAALAAAPATWGRSMYGGRQSAVPAGVGIATAGEPSAAPITATLSSPTRKGANGKGSKALASPEKGRKGSPEDDSSIRKEKVQEALRSKPQRGRKRDDLSEKERLELTRTRNREHAKSTRIRKKARYQELLDREEQYKLLQKKEELSSQRRQAVQNFLLVRQGMLLNFLKETADNQASGQVSCSLAARCSSKEEVKTTEEESNAASFDYHNLLKELVDENVPFHFQTVPVNCSETADVELVMETWDKMLMNRLKQACLKDEVTLRSLKYEINGGYDNVALSKDGALCQFDLTIQPKETLDTSAQLDSHIPTSSRKVLRKGILAVQFVQDSSRLSSVSCITMEDHSDDFMTRNKSKEEDRASTVSPMFSRENLGSQLVHPSVVSLECCKKAPELDEGNGPGMSL